ncbi:MAG: hypothetical protein QXR58_00655 [Candidatus Micrarchaeaceae archaeon]
MARFDSDIVAVEKVPGQVWDLKLKDSHADKNANAYQVQTRRKRLIKRLFSMLGLSS